MNLQVSARKATSDDAAALAALRLSPVGGEGTLPPESDPAKYTEFFTTWLVSHLTTHLPFVAVIGSEVVGAAWLTLVERVPSPDRRYRRCGDVQSVYVMPQFRRQRVGTTLLAAVLAEARRLGLEHVTVHSNNRAAPLYQQVGFRHDPNWLSWNPITLG